MHKGWIIVICLVLTIPCNARAGAISSDYSGESKAGPLPFHELLLKDVKYILTSPSRWEWKEWETLFLYSGGIGAVMIVDDELYNAAQRNRTIIDDSSAKFIESFGSYPSFGIISGFYIYGAIGDSEKEIGVARDALASGLISGIVTSSLKVIVGRKRPVEEEGTYAFKPFGGDHSFPSGHTTQAFSVASVIAAHYDSPWIDIISYGMATLVGIMRIRNEAHFPSDTFAGALIGTMVGRAIVKYNRSQSKIKLTMSPEGVYLRVVF